MPHKFCPSCGGRIVCDFCVHYGFNGEDLPPPAKPGNRQCYVGYVGKGWCNQYGRAEDPGGPVGPCDDFECCMGTAKTEEVSQ